MTSNTMSIAWFKHPQICPENSIFFSPLLNWRALKIRSIRRWVWMQDTILQRQEDWQEDLYHLEIPTAWGALYNVWPGADIINHWSIKPGDHKMCPLWIHLPAIYRFWPMSRRKAGLNKHRIPLERDSSIRPSFFATLNCLQTLVPPFFHDSRNI